MRLQLFKKANSTFSLFNIVVSFGTDFIPFVNTGSAIHVVV